MIQFRNYLQKMNTGEYFTGAFSALVQNDYVEVYPDIYWRLFELEDGAKLMFTNDFLCLPPYVRTDIMSYLNIYRMRRISNPLDYEVGEYIERGAEGKIYTMGENFVLKVVSKPVEEDMTIEERLIHAAILRENVQPYLPAWANIVGGLVNLIDSNQSRYTVFPRVADGVSISDLREFCVVGHAREYGVNSAILRNFQGFNIASFTELYCQFETLGSMVKKIASKKIPQVKPFYDYASSNVLVDPPQEYDGQMFYGLSIIDQ